MKQNYYQHYALLLGILCPIILSALVFVVYWGGHYDYPRGDQTMYMNERYFFESAYDWFRHSLSYSRSRITYGGDYYLFRPGLMFVLSLQDILFRGDLLTTGISSILFYVLAVNTLFFSLRKKIGNIPSFLLAAIFATQAIGSEIVLWRHISPYMFTFSFSLLSFFLLESRLRSEKAKIGLYSILLFFSFTFLEYTATAALAFLFVLVAAIFLAKGNSSQLLVKKLLWGTSLPLIAYIIAYWVDFYTHNIPTFFGPGDKVQENYILLGWANFYALFSSTFRACFIPFSIDIDLIEMHRPRNDHTFLGNSLYINVGAVGGGYFMFQVFKTFYTKLRNGTLRVFDLNAVFVSLSLLTLLFSLAVFRGVARGPGYIYGATYYFAIFTGLWIFIAGYLWKNRTEFKTIKTKVISIAMLLFFIVLARYQLKEIKLQIAHYPNRIGQELTSKVEKGNEFFKNNPQYKLILQRVIDLNHRNIFPSWDNPPGQNFKSTEYAALLPHLLYQHQKQIFHRNKSTPTVLVKNQDNYFVHLVNLPETEKYQSERLLKKNENKQIVFLSERSGPIDFLFSLPEKEELTIFVDYEGEGNFLAFHIAVNKIYVEAKKPNFNRPLPFNQSNQKLEQLGKMNIQIVYGERYIFLLVNGVITTFTEYSLPVNGRFGISFSSDKSSEDFYEIFYREQSQPRNLISNEPLYALE